MVLYYPGILDPKALGLTAADPGWEPALAAYGAGDLPAALAARPVVGAGESEPVQVFRAALSLAAGQVGEAEAQLARVGAGNDSVREKVAALRELIATVRGDGFDEGHSPASSAGWLARSYYWQARHRLVEALAAAREAVRLAPDSGYAWQRVAELEWAFGRRRAARQALDAARQKAPRLAPAFVLEGFLSLDQRDAAGARRWFEQATSLDGALGLGWLGRGLAAGLAGEVDDARQLIGIAAALEPRRSVFRSYLGRAFAEAGEREAAAKDFRLARQLDPADPTAWYYSGLEAAQDNRPVTAVRELEEATALNDGRAVVRSRLLLDQDRAMRSADLAAVFDSVGLGEAARRAASRAVADSYADFSGHLLVARTLERREDPNRFNLRYETPRQAELLLANLLAPPGAGNLSQVLSEQDRLRGYGLRPVGISSRTEYRSRGDWEQAGAVYGEWQKFGYALDTQYRSLAGQRPGADLEETRWGLQARWQVAEEDGIYLQVTGSELAAGDVAQHFDTVGLRPGFRVSEDQEPLVLVGYHHAWGPGSHSLLLAGLTRDRLSITNPGAQVLFLRQRGGQTVGVEPVSGPLGLSYRSRFELGTVEGQQIWEDDRHGVIVGGRYQSGQVDAQARLTPALPSFEVDDGIRADFERVNGYGFYQARPTSDWRLTAGLAWDWVRYPQNADLAPLSPGEAERSVWEPKLSVDYTPWRGGRWRAAYARSLGGLYLDDSLRLEPTQLAGFTTAYRSLVPESAAGLVPGTRFDTVGIGFDQVFTNGLHLGGEVEWLKSDGGRTVGALTNSLPVPVADSPTQLRQELDFRERNVSAYATWLFQERWATGVQYRLSEAELDTAYPELRPEAFQVASPRRRERSVLGQAGVFLTFQHEAGWFARWETDWIHQGNHWDSASLGSEDFWQHHLMVGYRWPRRRAELQVGVLNLTDTDYRLNPLNLAPEYARGRTGYIRLRINL
jgi:tetratricopeptide (TPR) repeat protein